MYTDGTTARVKHGCHRSTETSLTHQTTLSASSMIGTVYAACEVCAVCGAWSWNKWPRGGKQRRAARRKRQTARKRMRTRRRKKRVVSRRRHDSRWRRLSALRQAHVKRKLLPKCVRRPLRSERLKHNARRSKRDIGSSKPAGRKSKRVGRRSKRNGRKNKQAR